MAGLKAGKPVFCEWPLGANLAEAEEMNNLAKEKSLRTMVGLQARSDPSVMYARDLIAQGHIGEVLTANLSVVSGAQLVRGPGRIWQGQRSNGANTFTISRRPRLRRDVRHPRRVRRGRGPCWRRASRTGRPKRASRCRSTRRT